MCAERLRSRIRDAFEKPNRHVWSRSSFSYLDGSPIAGSSTFIIVPVDPTTSRVTQIFLYQEQTADFARFFSSGGLRLHNQVVYSQVEQSAKLIGARVVESDIPEEYANL